MGYDKLVVKKRENDVIVIDNDRLVDVRYAGRKDNHIIVNDELAVIQIRGGYTFKDKALYLSSHYDWVLGKDENDIIVLVPLKKMNEEE